MEVLDYWCEHCASGPVSPVIPETQAQNILYNVFWMQAQEMEQNILPVQLVYAFQWLHQRLGLRHQRNYRSLIECGRCYINNGALLSFAEKSSPLVLVSGYRLQ